MKPPPEEIREALKYIMQSYKLAIAGKPVRDADEVLSYCEAALARFPVDGGWMPIETAPKDKPILLYAPKLGRIIGQWFNHSDGGWWVAHAMPVSNPILWQPLPAAPQKKEG